MAVVQITYEGSIGQFIGDETGFALVDAFLFVVVQSIPPQPTTRGVNLLGQGASSFKEGCSQWSCRYLKRPLEPTYNSKQDA